jgi:hypothetical protein
MFYYMERCATGNDVSHVTGSNVSHVTGSGVSDVTGSDVSHVTGSDVIARSEGIDVIFPRFFLTIVVVVQNVPLLSEAVNQMTNNTMTKRHQRNNEKP